MQGKPIHTYIYTHSLLSILRKKLRSNKGYWLPSDLFLFRVVFALTLRLQHFNTSCSYWFKFVTIVILVWKPKLYEFHFNNVRGKNLGMMMKSNCALKEGGLEAKLIRSKKW